SICACVAKIFHVKETEVALLELRGSLLSFLYPAELKTAGAIPLSSSAVAARTARTKQSELFNSCEPPLFRLFRTLQSAT
ncbi:MAG: hypothetical protein ABR881_31505, partial [Candidatus Sulfotelmatobacter sp.]